ncbi:MAG: hypothetical protein LQ342_005916 [Letrouitia transgressa]|nr:MAG: hypothetical protein LQ342_005916 [Letrouitia transgressa]
MFSALSQVSGTNTTGIQTRKALIVFNVQNDTFYRDENIYICKNHDFVDKIKVIVPHFRSIGDIVWVKTEMARLPTPASPDSARTEAQAAKMDKQNREERQAEEANLEDNIAETRDDLEPVNQEDIPTWHPSSRAKAMMQEASAQARADQRSANLEIFNDTDVLEEQLTKPRKGPQPRFFVGGTKGAELADDILPYVDGSEDIHVTAHFYSAFDQTSLLTTLRMKLVTEVYLCGALTNVSVYSTAADAVQHGLDVTVIEDCLGYRNEQKHVDAMRQMADIMGVNGIDSEELIQESGGVPPPDTENPMFTGPGVEGIALEGLSLKGQIPVNGMFAFSSVKQLIKLMNSDDPAAVEESEECRHSPPTNVSEPSAIEDKVAEIQSDLYERKSLAPQRISMGSRDSWPPLSRTLGPKDAIGTGDSRIIHSVIKPPLSDQAFELLRQEVRWQTMHHRSGKVPRLVAVQGEIENDGSIPIYRHPADESPPLLPFTSTVQAIRKELEATLKQPFNHALIQLYRNGEDNISEHSDKTKTLDIVRNSNIINVSFGAQRAMTLRTKKSQRAKGTESPTVSRQSQRVIMPHNSVFVLGPKTNMQWLHGVRADKRPAQQRSDEEKAFGGERISITFRQIGTFTDPENRKIWGQGAKKRSKSTAGPVRASDSQEMEAMVKAFGKENHQSEFDWDAEYGSGFDVINLIPNEKTKLVLCADRVANLRVQLALLEKKIPFTLTGPKPPASEGNESKRSRYKSNPWSHGLSNTENPVFTDLDEECSETEGDLAILFYLEKFYPFEGRPDDTTAATPGEGGMSRANTFNLSRAAQSNELLFLWRNVRAWLRTNAAASSSSSHLADSVSTATTTTSEQSDQDRSKARQVQEFEKDLDLWEDYAGKATYIAEDSWTLIDCAFWPVLNDVVHGWQGFKPKRYPNLASYHERVLGRECVVRLLGEG